MFFGSGPACEAFTAVFAYCLIAHFKNWSTDKALGAVICEAPNQKQLCISSSSKADAFSFCVFSVHFCVCSVFFFEVVPGPTSCNKRTLLCSGKRCWCCFWLGRKSKIWEYHLSHQRSLVLANSKIYIQQKHSLAFLSTFFDMFFQERCKKRNTVFPVLSHVICFPTWWCWRPRGMLGTGAAHFSWRIHMHSTALSIKHWSNPCGCALHRKRVTLPKCWFRFRAAAVTD